jgi:hypothetical protein
MVFTAVLCFFLLFVLPLCERQSEQQIITASTFIPVLKALYAPRAWS